MRLKKDRIATAVLVVALVGSMAILFDVKAGPGDVDMTFGEGGVSFKQVPNIYTSYNGPSTILTQPDGKILICGQIDSYGIDGWFFLARLNPSGSLDPTFGYQGMIIGLYSDHYVGADMVLQPDGRIVVVGNHGEYPAIQRYESDGGLDLSFGDSGTAYLKVGSYAESVALQPDGKIVVAIRHWDWANPPGLARLNPDGSPDEGFGNNGVLITHPADMRGIRKVVVQPDRKLVIIGGIPHETCCATSGIAIMRYLPNGSRDSSFGSNGRVIRSNLAVEYPEDAALQPGGKIVVSSRGDNSSFPSAYGGRLTRFNTDGSVDTGFIPGNVSLWGTTMPAEVSMKLAIQPDGKVVMASFVPNSTYAMKPAIVRLNQNGSPDSSFGINGKSFPAYGALAADISIQPDGKILALGGASGYGSLFEFWVTRTHGDPALSVSGRVTTPAGLGLRNAIVTLTDSAGNRRTVLTSSLGFYSFDDIAAGGTVTITAASRRYRFQPVTRTANESLSDIDFEALE